MQKKGRESVRKSTGYHVWQEKSYINPAQGTSGRTPVLGRQKGGAAVDFTPKAKQQHLRGSEVLQLMCWVQSGTSTARETQNSWENPENSTKEIKKAL